MPDRHGAAKVLIVDDDPNIRLSLERGLALEGFEILAAADGRSALAAVNSWEPNLMVLDVSMPGLNGVEVCRQLRAEGNDLPICMLSAKDEVADRVAGLRAGADDYLIKPFSLIELEARLRALIRRQDQTSPATIEVGALRIDTERRRVTCGSSPIELTKREFDLLRTLAINTDIVLDRQKLLSLVWGYDFESNANVVDVFVGYLRKKLEADGQRRLIHTVRGVGFVLRP